jgi:hypothetical protein
MFFHPEMDYMPVNATVGQETSTNASFVLMTDFTPATSFTLRSCRMEAKTCSNAGNEHIPRSLKAVTQNLKYREAFHPMKHPAFEFRNVASAQFGI